jgi:tRNA(fMet)-specific endonuclease VapC
MANYLLDTNHASPLVTLHHRLRQRVLDEHRKGHTFAICTPALSEILFGIGVLPRAVQNRKEWDNLRPSLTIYHIGEDDAEMAASLQIALRRQGRQLDTVDALVAAIAIRYNLILLTTDKDFRPITQLKSENWL